MSSPSQITANHLRLVILAKSHITNFFFRTPVNCQRQPSSARNDGKYLIADVGVYLRFQARKLSQTCPLAMLNDEGFEMHAYGKQASRGTTFSLKSPFRSSILSKTAGYREMAVYSLLLPFKRAARRSSAQSWPSNTGFVELSRPSKNQCDADSREQLSPWFAIFCEKNHSGLRLFIPFIM